jgi:excisionase family DNA binding protein
MTPHKEGGRSVQLPDPRDKPTLSVDEVAAILGFGRSSVYAAVRQGTIPALRIGSRIRIPTARLRELIGDPEQAVPASPPITEAPEPRSRDQLVELLAEVVARGIVLAKERGAL